MSECCNVSVLQCFSVENINEKNESNEKNVLWRSTLFPGVHLVEILNFRNVIQEFKDLFQIVAAQATNSRMKDE